jgi:hypothetical protein
MTVSFFGKERKLTWGEGDSNIGGTAAVIAREKSGWLR